jgi:MYXO-CTERM domain-containing protein
MPICPGVRVPEQSVALHRTMLGCVSRLVLHIGEITMRHAVLGFLVAFASLTSVTWSVESKAAGCGKGNDDIDCPGMTCGGEVCSWCKTGMEGPMCASAGAAAAHCVAATTGDPGWCSKDSDCKCMAEGATCDTGTHYCSFTQPQDAGTDSGSGEDAGTTPESGTSEDAGTVPETGTGEDASASPETGTSEDASASPEATAPETGTGSDASLGSDAPGTGTSSGSSTSSTSSGGGGGGCTVGSGSASSSGAGLGALAVAGIFALGRRRRRHC